MPNTLTARNMDLTESMRHYVDSKVDRLRKIFDSIQKIEIILSTDKLKRGEADLLVAATQATLKCTARDASALAAFDIAMEKMERQLERHKARIVGNKKHLRENPRRFAGEELAPLPGTAATAIDDELPDGQPVRPEELGIREAMDRFVRGHYEMLIFIDSATRNPSVLFRDQEGENRLMEIVGER